MLSFIPPDFPVPSTQPTYRDYFPTFGEKESSQQKEREQGRRRPRTRQTSRKEPMTPREDGKKKDRERPLLRPSKEDLPLVIKLPSSSFCCRNCQVGRISSYFFDRVYYDHNESFPLEEKSPTNDSSVEG